MGEQKRHFFNPDVDEKHTIWLALGSLDKLPEGEWEQSANKIPSNIAMCTVRERKKKNMKGCLCVK